MDILTGVAAPILGSIIGQAQSSGDRATSREASDRAYAELMNIGLPPDLSKQLILKEFKQAGMLDPEMEQHIELGASKVAQIQSDPKLRAEQMRGVDVLKQISRGGLRPEDRAALNQIRDTTAQDEQSKLAQIQQNMQSRGMGGSGAELASALSSTQAGTNRASKEGDQLAALSSQRALDALTKGSTLAGNVREQDFGENKAKASSADEFQRFNVQAKQQEQARNVANQNAAQQYNINQAQAVSNNNVNLANNEQLRQANAKRTYYNDLAARAGVRAGAENTKANDFAGRAGATMAANQGYAGAATSLVSGLGGMDFGGGSTGPSYGGPSTVSEARGLTPFSHGGLVEGEPHVIGDSEENDEIHAVLSPGEIVIPRSIVQGDDVPKHAASFVAGVLAAKRNKKG